MSIIKVKRYLQAIAVVHIAGGLLLPYLVHTFVFDSYHAQLSQAFGITTPEALHQATFLMGLFGPTIASWGILFLFIVTTSFDQPSPKTWWTILLACLAWAPYDSYLSIAHGMYYNAILNGIAFVAIMLPLLLVKGHFFTPRDPRVSYS